MTALPKHKPQYKPYDPVFYLGIRATVIAYHEATDSYDLNQNRVILHDIQADQLFTSFSEYVATQKDDPMVKPVDLLADHKSKTETAETPATGAEILTELLESGKATIGVPEASTEAQISLPEADQKELDSYEAIIDAGLKTFIEVGNALLAIRDKKLYRVGYSTFEDYCNKRWNLQERRAYQYMDAAQVVNNLKVEQIVQLLPTNEAQARPLTPLEPEQQREAWDIAMEIADGKQPTAAQVKEAVQEVKASSVDDHHEILPQTETPADELREESTTSITTTSEGRHKPKTNRTSDEESPLFDRCQTPAYALIPLLPYLKPEWTVWEAAAGNGRLVEALIPHVAKVSASDILSGEDFFSSSRSDFDAIITNPPYSTKYDWLKHCYELEKPFALLIPGESLFAASGAELFEKYGVELLIPKSRIDFEMPEMGFDGNGAQFPTAWFTWGFNIGKVITYVDISAEKKAFKEALKGESK